MKMEMSWLQILKTTVSKYLIHQVTSCMNLVSLVRLVQAREHSISPLELQLAAS